jgi:hypothetical protein
MTGLGQMGFGMAKNIRRKIAQESTLIIFDVNHAAMDRFVEEFDNNVNIIQAKSPKEVAEKAVCTAILLHWCELQSHVAHRILFSLLCHALRTSKTFFSTRKTAYSLLGKRQTKRFSSWN